MKRAWTLAVVQAVLLLAGFGLFVTWAQWLGCKSLANLSLEDLPHAPPPPDARCYSISHGSITFHTHGTAAEDPLAFWVVTLAFLACAGGLVLSTVLFADSPLGRFIRWSIARRHGGSWRSGGSGQR